MEKDKQNLRLSVFFPTYNEEVNLERTVKRAISTIQKYATKYEVIFVNDGSRDRTLEVAQELARKYSFLRVISHEVNRGYGGALQSGLYGAKYPWIVFTDADGQFDFGELSVFLKEQQKTGADLVIGYYLKRQVSLIRKLGSFAWQVAVWLLFGLRVRDIDCGFKLIRKEVVDKISKLESERGPFITSELLIKAKRKGYKIVEVGVHHYPRMAGKATGASLKVIWSGFADLLRLRQKLSHV